MQDHLSPVAAGPNRMPWNKGKLMGAKPPLRPKHVWSIRTKLQIAKRTRDLAMFNLAIDSKLRGCDVVAIKGIGESATARLLSGSVDLPRAAGQRMRSALTRMLTATTVIVQKVTAATYAVTGRFSMPQWVQSC